MMPAIKPIPVKRQTPDEYVLPVGQYCGVSLGTVWHENPEYLVWLYNAVEDETDDVFKRLSWFFDQQQIDPGDGETIALFAGMPRTLPSDLVDGPVIKQLEKMQHVRSSKARCQHSH